MAAPNLLLISLLVCFAFVRVSEACGGTFTSSSGIIQSPGFPNNYDNNVSCIYVITAPDNQRITLNFTHFDLEPPASGSVCVDYVEVRDGNNSRSPRFGHYCNNTLPGIRRSFGSQMWIKFSTNSAVVRTGFRITYTTGSYDSSFFLITSSSGSIFRMDAETRSNYNLPLTLRNPIAVTYDPVGQRVYWTEVGSTNNIIASASSTGSDLQIVKNAGIGALYDGLAIDPLSRLLFYTDAGNDVIGMLTLSTHSHRTIINSSLDKPRAIVLHTAHGIMIWTDWGGPAKIERANYDGSDRRTLVDYNLLYINALALDLANNRLYWADAGTDAVESVNLDGGDRPGTPVLRATSTRHFFGMALFRNALYITDWGPDGPVTTSTIIIRQPLGADQNNRTIFGSIGQRMNDIHAYDQDVLTTGPNGCGNNNGGCSIICIPLPGNHSKCLCPDGERLLADKTTCVDDSSVTTTTQTTTTTTPTVTSTTQPTPELANVTVDVKTSHQLPFIADGSRDLTLSCDLDRPVTRYECNVQCSSEGENWCVFQPGAADDGKKVMCTVTLTDGRTAAGSVVLSLKYPPQTPPFISGYDSGSPLQVGDSLTMICTVQGGKPLVSAVIFSCQDHRDNERDIRGRTEMASLLTISPVRKENNGTRSECRAEWQGTSTWNPPRQTIMLIVTGEMQESSTRATKQNIIPIVGGAAGGAIVIIIIIIVIVVIVKRNHPTYDKPPKKKKGKTEQEEDPPYSDLAVNNAAFDSEAVNAEPSGTVRESAIYAEISDLPLPDARPLPTPSRPDDDYLKPIANPAHNYHKSPVSPPPIPPKPTANPAYNRHRSPANPTPTLPKPIANPEDDYARFIKAN